MVGIWVASISYCQLYGDKHGVTGYCYAEFISFGNIRRSGMAGSYDKSVFRYLRYFHSDFIIAVVVYLPTNTG